MPALLRGRPEDPAWVRPALLGLLAGTLLLYTWGLSASGWANSFYSAAAQAGSVSWKAFFFGSSDAAGSITVDKPPMALWPQALAIRLFGLSSWSILVPEALMGVASVGVLYAAVRRWFGAAAGLLAGLVLALTPVAALMFRFNNPEALLTLLMTAAACTALRAIDEGRARWFVLTGVLVGFGFLTKQLQVLLVVPGFALAHLLCGKARLPRRAVDLALAFGAMVVAGGWWVAIVELWPADSRPYIGGSQDNSILELTLGYNGLGRLTGNETGSVGGGGGPGGAPGGGQGGFWGETGIARMLDGEVGGQIAWLLPAALAFLLIGLWLTRRAARTDLRRASLVVWGGWLVVTALTFSFMSGIFHAYYTVALAPAIGALVGGGAVLLWERRSEWPARAAMAAVTLMTGLWAAALLGRAPDWNPWLGDLVLDLSVLATAAFAVSALPESLVPGRASARIASGAAVAAVLLALVAPAAWSLETITTPQQGSLVAAGPAVPGSGPGGRGGPPGIGSATTQGALPGANTQAQSLPPLAGSAPGGLPLPGGAPVMPSGQLPLPSGNGSATDGLIGGSTPMVPPNGGDGLGAAPGTGGGPGGLLTGPQVSDEAVETLSEDSGEYTWVAATTGSQNASSYQLATELPVMPIGGFNGSDPSPTLEQFQDYVAEGQIHWYIASGLSGMGSMGGSDEARRIAEWVAESFEPVSVGGATFYDLSTTPSQG